MDKMESSSVRTIDVMIVIDTESIKNDTTLAKSLNPDSPTMINNDLNSKFFMVCSGSRGAVVSQGTSNLQITANVGDNVNLRVTSVYGNSDDAVIIYNVVPLPPNNNVFGLFTARVVNFNAVQPDPSKYNGLPQITVLQNFSSFSGYVAKTGTENFAILFALYVKDEDKDCQVLLGYYKYDPTITVK